VVVVAVAGRCYKKDTAAGQVSPSSSFAADYSNLGRHLNRKVQMTMLRGSFFQSDTETLPPSKHMLLCSEDPLAAILGNFPSLVTASNDPEAEPYLGYFQLPTTWKYLPHKTPWAYQNWSYDEEASEMTGAADVLDQPVGFVRECTADATVSVASHIVDGGRIVPILHLDVATIESAYVNVRMVSVVDTAVAYACPYFVRHNHDSLESHYTSFGRNEKVGWCQPSFPRIESFELDAVVRL
jgi:hypothetical protein